MGAAPAAWAAAQLRKYTLAGDPGPGADGEAGAGVDAGWGRAAKVGAVPGPGRAVVGQVDSTRTIAWRSAAVTHTRYLTLTATIRATYAHLLGLLGGSQVATSPSALARLTVVETASRFSGSLANASRVPAGGSRRAAGADP